MNWTGDMVALAPGRGQGPATLHIARGLHMPRPSPLNLARNILGSLTLHFMGPARTSPLQVTAGRPVLLGTSGMVFYGLSEALHTNW